MTTKAEQIRAALELGDYSVQQIADAFDVRPEYVRVVRQRMQPGGAAARREWRARWSAKWIEKIGPLRAQGLTAKQISDATGLSDKTIYWLVSYRNRGAGWERGENATGKVDAGAAVGEAVAVAGKARAGGER